MDWSIIAVKVAAAVLDAHQWGDSQEIEICGKKCQVQIKGRLHKLKWVWDVRCECDGIIGESRHYSARNTAVQNAIQDFVIKAGKITSEYVQQ